MNKDIHTEEELKDQGFRKLGSFYVLSNSGVYETYDLITGGRDRVLLKAGYTFDNNLMYKRTADLPDLTDLPEPRFRLSEGSHYAVKYYSHSMWEYAKAVKCPTDPEKLMLMSPCHTGLIGEWFAVHGPVASPLSAAASTWTDSEGEKDE